MITVPPAAQVALGAMSNAELKDALTTALRDVAYGLWEATRRGYVVQAEHERTAALNADQAREILVTVSKEIHL